MANPEGYHQQENHTVRNGLLLFALLMSPQVANYAGDRLARHAVNAKIGQMRSVVATNPDLQVLPDAMATAVAFNPTEGLDYSGNLHHDTRLDAYNEAVDILTHEERRVQGLRIVDMVAGE